MLKEKDHKARMGMFMNSLMTKSNNHSPIRKLDGRSCLNFIFRDSTQNLNLNTLDLESMNLNSKFGTMV